MPLAASAKVGSAYLDQRSVTCVSMPYLFYGGISTSGVLMVASAKVRSAYLDQRSVTWVSMPYLFYG